jgi:uncharacterized membrane protein YqjE
MAEDQQPRTGMLQSLRRLCETGATLLHNRMELFGIELREAEARLIKVLLLAAAAIFLGNAALLVLTATIVIAVGEKARVPVLIGLCVFYVVAAAAAYLFIRKEIHSTPPPFSGTVGELRKDQEWLRGRN